MMAHRFLIVDDDPHVTDAVAALLTYQGFAVLTATNGQEALDLIAELLPSLVFLDLHMPVLDGWGFVRALQERDLRLPIILMSSDRQIDRWASELGAVAFLSKPFGMAQLLSTVEVLLDSTIAEPSD